MRPQQHNNLASSFVTTAERRVHGWLHSAKNRFAITCFRHWEGACAPALPRGARPAHALPGSDSSSVRVLSARPPAPRQSRNRAANRELGRDVEAAEFPHRTEGLWSQGATCVPVGRWVMRTFEDVLFIFCPPRPDPAVPSFHLSEYAVTHLPTGAGRDVDQLTGWQELRVPHVPRMKSSSRSACLIPRSWPAISTRKQSAVGGSRMALRFLGKPRSGELGPQSFCQRFGPRPSSEPHIRPW
jgi:hypothetical protein